MKPRTKAKKARPISEARPSTLFRSGPDWESEALLGSSPDWFLGYAFSYKIAADNVVARVEAKEVSPDSVAYAVCFLYRHYVELMLKGLINIGTELESGRPTYPTDKHRIDRLWKTCRPLIEGASWGDATADLDEVEQCIAELTEMDPSGEAFRFGENRQGTPIHFKTKQFNLSNMRNVMSRIASFLEGSYDMMDELLYHQPE